jgi:lipopolysaccharide export system protein LptA
MKRKVFFALLAVLLFVSVPKISVSGSQPEKETKNKKSAPIQIVSDRLDAYNDRGLVVFSGNVVATQEDKIIKSDKLFLHYKKREGESEKVGSKNIIKAGELEKAEAKGNVRITQGERIVTGENAVFYNDSQKAIVTGNPVMQDGENIIKGEKIIVLLEENRGIVESTPSNRVKATIYPKETEGEKK